MTFSLMDMMITSKKFLMEVRVPPLAETRPQELPVLTVNAVGAVGRAGREMGLPQRTRFSSLSDLRSKMGC